MGIAKKNENSIDKIKKKTRKCLYLNTYVQLIDNKKVIVENCKNILECNDILVRIQTADFDINIWGNYLTINDFSAEFVVINGLISSIEISAKGRTGSNVV